MKGEVPLTEVIEPFASALGAAKASALVRRAALHEGRDGDPLPLADALAVLAHLATEPGIIGITARLASTRLRRKHGEEPPPSGDPAPASARRIELCATDPGALFDALVDALAGTLGPERAREAALSARAALSLPAPLDHAACIALLDHLGAGSGIVSTTARFVKVRFLLSAPR